MPQLITNRRAAKAPRKQGNTRSNTPPLFMVTSATLDTGNVKVGFSENVANMILSGNPPFTVPGHHVTSAVLDPTDNTLTLTFDAAITGTPLLSWPQWMPQLRDQSGGWLAPGSITVGE